MSKRRVLIVGWGFVAIVLLGFFYSLILAYKYFTTSPVVQRLDPSLVIAFDNKYSEDELREMQNLTSDALQYKPWVQFGNYDHKNKYSIVVQNNRATINNPNCLGDTKVIWFFGGSTMYGWGVPWWDTIPSNFVKESELKGKCVNAVNYGVPYFYSRQEFIYFITELLSNEKKPDFVVFLDGLNDFGQPGSSINGVPFFTPSLEAAIPHGKTINKDNPNSVGEFLNKLKLSFFSIFNHEDVGNNLSRVNYLVPEDMENFGAYKIAKIIVGNYLENRVALSAICAEYKIRCYQFLQPISIMDYNPKHNADPLTEYVRENPKFDKQRALMLNGYEQVKHYIKTVQKMQNYYSPIYDLSDSFLLYDGLPYIDSGHYSPRANKLIANKIVHTIF